tara:strand:- start:480 stop:680 length:201 start_codon:yes stop_codon:yes gene_type:complete
MVERKKIMAEQNELHFETIDKNKDIKFQADKFDLAIKNAKLLDTLNLRLLVTNLTNILNERDKNAE